MNAEIISIGTELLMGETVDTNSSYIGEQSESTLPGPPRWETIPIGSRKLSVAPGAARTSRSPREVWVQHPTTSRANQSLR